MALIQLRQIILSFGGHPLFDQADLNINSGEHICIIGRNGVGKSTLLKMIAGMIRPDEGQFEQQQGLVISYLPQDIPHDFTGTIYDVVAEGLGALGQLLIEYEHVNHQMVTDHSDAIIAKSAELQHKIDSQNGWVISQKINKVLSQLSLNPDTETQTLSGGMRRRVLLAKALVNEPDVLLLDEPTNHLDVEAIIHLEAFLQNFKKTVLFVSHDRAFMQNVATRIVEVDNGKIFSWKGTYHDYLKHKAEALEAEATQQALFDKKLAQEEVWIRKGIKARRTRNEGRVRELEKMREERQQRRVRQGQAKLTVQEFEKSGKIIFDAEHVNFVYEHKTIIKDFSTTIVRGDKIGIIGENGSGKTTLLKLLLGELQSQSGSVKQGTNLTVAYFDQYRAQLDESKTVQECVCEGSDEVTVNGRTIHSIGYLQNFLFSPERARTPVKALSGGERNRLLLAKAFSKPSNVLVMDEPTNDLDVETLELLEELLLDYSGTLLLVSHDRAFINNVVTSTLVFEGEGVIGEYVGGYDDWQRYVQSQRVDKISSSKKAGAAKKQDSKSVSVMSTKEKRELEKMPEKINALEAQINTMQQQIAAPGFYEQPHHAEVIEQCHVLEQQLEKLYQRWDELET